VGVTDVVTVTVVVLTVVVALPEVVAVVLAEDVLDSANPGWTNSIHESR
jgi:hypothetical protein